MQPNAPIKFGFWPEQASTFAFEVDLLFGFLMAVTLLFCIPITAAIIYFAVRYKRKSENDRPPHIEASKTLEIVWSVIPLFFVVIMFFWGAQLFFEQRTPPPDALQVDVTGKKWMWKFQHKNGRREINRLHVPVNQPVKLRMASEDVIHDVFIPAFRVKQDVLPGRYTMEWFEATKPGTYDLFCNQYCGTMHSYMVGTVVVMEQADYQNWLAGFTGETPEKSGENLFNKYACNTCHMAGSGQRGPDLAGLLGSKVALKDGNVITADENYIRESILNPQGKVVAGFDPVMPSFQGVLNEDQINHLIAYLKTLKPAAGAASHAAAAAGGIQITPAASAPAPTDAVTSPTATQGAH